LEVACPEIAFLGVWDPVAAYGSPLAELTRGIDRYVFPLSMPHVPEKVPSASDLHPFVIERCNRGLLS
jgi:hypothetical protein